MIKKLRIKFMAYAMASIFVFLALILGAINIVNFVRVGEEGDTITKMIMEEGGKFAPKDEGGEPPTTPEGDSSMAPSSEGEIGPGQRGPDSPETRDSTRYFTAVIDSNGNGAILEGAFHISSFSENQATEWAKTLVGKEKGWSKTNYRYRTYTLNNDGNTYVTVIDMSRELDPSYRILWASLGGTGVGLVISFIALIFVSKWMVKPIEESNKKQKRFISDASHELKTPLTIISANNEILEIEHGENEMTRTIDKQVKRLNEMVKNLNSLAKLDEGVPEKFTEVKLSEIANELCEVFEGNFTKKGLRFDKKIDDNLVINGNDQLISKLIAIFLDNAAKYANTYACLSVIKDGSRILIRCDNDAEGIKEGSLDMVMERFYRSDNARASSVEGSGIGLSIAKEIVLAHKGRIYASGHDGVFTIKAEF